MENIDIDTKVQTIINKEDLKDLYCQLLKLTQDNESYKNQIETLQSIQPVETTNIDIQTTIQTTNIGIQMDDDAVEPLTKYLKEQSMIKVRKPIVENELTSTKSTRTKSTRTKSTMVPYFFNNETMIKCTCGRPLVNGTQNYRNHLTKPIHSKYAAVSYTYSEIEHED